MTVSIVHFLFNISVVLGNLSLNRVVELTNERVLRFGFGCHTFLSCLLFVFYLLGLVRFFVSQVLFVRHEEHSPERATDAGNLNRVNQDKH